VDISDPEHPVDVDRYDTVEIATGVARHGDYILLANRAAGMLVFRSFTGAFDVFGDTGRSRILDTTDETIRLVCVQIDRTGSVSFELSADGGTNWQNVPVNNVLESRPFDQMPSAWVFLDHPGQDLMWRTVHNYQNNGVNPILEYLRIDYSSEVATLLQHFSAKVIGTDVEIEWRLSQIDEGIEFIISRIEADGDFPRILDSSEILREDLAFCFIDSSIEPGMKYRYHVEYMDGSVRRTLFETDQLRTPDLPVTLFQNTPNPFNPSTSIRFYLPERTAVRLEIFDAAGRQVRTLINGERERGYAEAFWDGTCDRGHAVASGVYFCRLEAGKHGVSRKMVLLR